MANNDLGKILLVDDDQPLGESLHDILEIKGYQVAYVKDGDYALDLLEKESFDIVITDFEMPVMNGMELLDRSLAIKPDLPVIITTAFTTTDRAIEATKHGAFDYLPKPVEVEALLEVIHKAIQSGRLTAKPITMGKIIPGKDTIIGSSQVMQNVFKEVGRIAANPIPVLITGETGTGKELIARAIFQHSKLAQNPFIAVNCAAIPEPLIESELFGHERGAFTGAIHKRIGRFEQANGGTLFLDEIGDLPWKTQVKLLRILQEKTLTRVGGKESIPINVRLITATHRNLDDMISERTFREDLFFRINATQINLPPLRDRLEDIEPLTDYLLAKYAAEFGFTKASIHKDARMRLLKHYWSGNIRELENVLRKSLIEARGRTISTELIESSIHIASHGKPDGAAQSPTGSRSTDLYSTLVAQVLGTVSRGGTDGQAALPYLTKKIEEELFRQAFVLANYNQSKMAKLIGVSRLTIRDRLDKYNLLPVREKKNTST